MQNVRLAEEKRKKKKKRKKEKKRKEKKKKEKKMSHKVKVIRVQKPEDFDNTMESLVGAPHLYVCLFGSEDPQTGESWCPDCVIGIENKKIKTNKTKQK